MKVITLNPQLVSLILHDFVWTVILRYIRQNLLNLQYLSITFDNGDFLGFLGDVVVLKINGLFTCSCNKCGCIRNYYGGIPISFDRLEEITCKLNFASICENIIDFFRANQSISQLNLQFIKTHYVLELSNEEIVKIATALPRLQKANFNRISLSTDSVLSFLRICESLKTFRFRFSKYSEFDGLIKFLSDEWKASINYLLNVELERTNQNDN